MIGTARCLEFRERDGRRTAVRHLVERGIDRLVVIGGDGSLSGANLLREEWPSLVEELVTEGAVDQETADRHPALMIAGLVGSIDNDMLGTDRPSARTPRCTGSSRPSTPSTRPRQSHQRCFVVEVMGRHCGYLALMSALAGERGLRADPGDGPRTRAGRTTCARCSRTGGPPGGATTS